MGIQIGENLRQRFAAELPEYYQRRIIFWHDPEGEFAQMAEELCPEGVKLIRLTGANNFAVKMLLSETDLSSDYLVYDPLTYDSVQDDWLLDIKLYSEEFRADLVSLQMQELNIPDTQQTRPLRKTVKGYAKFFENKARVARLKSYDSNYGAAGQLHIDIMAVLSDAEANTAPGVIRAVLQCGLEEENNAALTQIKKFGNEAAWWELAGRYTGYTRGAQAGLFPLAAHILLTALSVTMKPSALRGLEKWISAPHQQLCYSLIHEWLHAGDDAALYDLTRAVEEELGLPEIFDSLEVPNLLDSDCFPCIDECILRRYMTDISDHAVKPVEIIAAVERRRTLKWYSRLRYYYDGLLYAAQMRLFHQEHAGGFHAAQYAQLWKDYCGDSCKMDHYYRLFHAAFGKSLKETNTGLEDLYKNVADYVERLYKNWYLDALGRQWTTLAADELAAHGELAELPRQTNFYRDHVKPVIAAGSRAFVIISDALRYEVGVELTGQLQRETKGTAWIASMQSILPSVTKYGMAALLPHKELRLNTGLDPECDGIPAAGTENRQKILQAAHPGNTIFTYKSLLSMKKAERREKISGAQAVYIYHNTIDAAGDKAVTEDQVFAACEQAIVELKNLVRLICNDMNGTNIIITADHGFLYSHQPLAENDKLEKALLPGDILELERRYVIAEGGDAAEYMLKLPLRAMRSEYYAFLPLDAIRIKKPGGGMNYVHGGFSLQEMVVPIIEYKNIRASSRKFVDVKKVGLQLISQSRKVSNGMFSLDFYQTEPVGGKVDAASYEIYMADASGAPVSDRQKIIADRTSKNGSERVFRIRLTLKGIEFDNTQTYYLTIAEQGAAEPAQRIEFSIDIAFANDFDF